MQRVIIILFFIVSPSMLFAQENAWSWFNDVHKKAVEEKKKTEAEKTPDRKDRLVRYDIVDGDTIVVIDLPDVVVMDKEYKKQYDRDLYYIKRMYPYARLIAEIKQENDSFIQSADKRRDRRKYLDKRKDMVFAQFDEAVKKMSINEGKYLVKLIHRECGATAYNVISDYLGGVKTFMWQTVSRMGGADLKIKYDPTGEDKIMEEILSKIEKGEIKVRKLKIDENAVENKAKAKEEAKKKKKEEKKKKK